MLVVHVAARCPGAPERREVFSKSPPVSMKRSVGRRVNSKALGNQDPNMKR